ncbi:class I SAM-dependent methyltransferase [Phytoactinopolyspora halotolerans]|uniref:Methyltransferase domain-containing protein n=1 Tax=Phytoactinopolyspora halotolerans TaxID=1981512 RepID=A0A6L9SC70_9ACTN|nr:class I SAM-dependent methyltransferase [Phytoactinopolyspora halotolerans]NEE02274.1 methyltransferase domain-containing protein [Phytoactinopolyspora halotolerans]
MSAANRAQSFGQIADDYDRIRPTYPPEAVTWALGPSPRRVLDLGAGTGILSRIVDALGHDVVAVEPDAQMHARLVSATPGVEAVNGSAESIPLPDGSVDAVVAGQAYHWFRTDAAHAEIARVLRPGGVFAPMWNLRDESVPWVTALTAAADLSHDGSSHVLELVDSFGPLFDVPEQAAFSHSVRMTPEGLVGLIRSRSYYLVSPPDEQDRLDAAVRGFCAEHPDLAGKPEFELPYLTYVFRAGRAASGSSSRDSPRSGTGDSP